MSTGHVVESCVHNEKDAASAFQELPLEGSRIWPVLNCALMGTIGQSMRETRRNAIFAKAAVFFLLFSVVGLSVAVKYAKYQPKSNHISLLQFAKAGKMGLVDHSGDFIPASACIVSRIIPPQPEFSPTRLIHSERTAHNRIGLTASFQHRAPPSWYA